MAKVGYARISTIDHDADAQTKALYDAGCQRVFVDVASRLAPRPQLEVALDYLRPGDALAVTELGRLGRSVTHVCHIVCDLRVRGMNLIVLNLGLDTSTPAGELAFTVFTGIAEFERQLLSERAREGLAAARTRGRTGNRQSVMTSDQIAIARQMYATKQHTLEVISRAVGVSRATLYRYLNQPETVDAGIQ